MSGAAEKAGPPLGATVSEVQAVFASDAALQDAMGRLRNAGFDHADLSLPAAHPPAGEATPNQGAATPLGDDDTRQARTLGTSMAGTVGAFAAAAATVATGGAAGVAIAAAAAVGAGSAALAHGASDAAKAGQDQARDKSAARGELVLAVRTTDADGQHRAEALMREAGATRVAAVTRENAAMPGTDSASWTG